MGTDEEKDETAAANEAGTAAEDNEEICMTGWDAIDDAIRRVYPGQDSPKHYGVLIPWRLGGPDPLDGISVYDGGDYWHFVTYGMSELYEKESENQEYSGYGMEFTFKLKKADYEDEEGEIRCICGILQSIARMTFNNGEMFYANEYIYTGQQQGMDSKQKSKITGLITIEDPQFKSIDTPNGKVDFVEFIGVTDAELRAIMDKNLRVAELYGKLGSDVTDYARESVVS